MKKLTKRVQAGGEADERREWMAPGSGKASQLATQHSMDDSEWVIDPFDTYEPGEIDLNG